MLKGMEVLKFCEKLVNNVFGFIQQKKTPPPDPDISPDYSHEPLQLQSMRVSIGFSSTLLSNCLPKKRCCCDLDTLESIHPFHIINYRPVVKRVSKVRCLCNKL